MSTQLAIRWGLCFLRPSSPQRHVTFKHFEIETWFCLLALLAFLFVLVRSSDKSVVNTCLKVGESPVVMWWHSDMCCVLVAERGNDYEPEIKSCGFLTQHRALN